MSVSVRGRIIRLKSGALHVKEDKTTVEVRGRPMEAVCLLILLALMVLAAVCWAAGQPVIGALLYMLAMPVMIFWMVFALRRQFHFTFDREANVVSVPGESIVDRLIRPEDIESVNILVGQLGVWQAAWLCLSVKGKSRFVILAQTLRWAATRSELAGLHQHAGRKLAVRFGCPFRLYFNSRPDMNRISFERYLRPIDLLKDEA